MSAMADADAEDVSDFLKRIQELGTRRDQEDEERNRKLEEEILQGRKERQARRAERARSISPTKDSPVGTPTASERFERSSRTTLSPAPDLKHPSAKYTRQNNIDMTKQRLTGEDNSIQASSIAFARKSPDNVEEDIERKGSVESSPSHTNSASRKSPLSWQRRPTSQVPERLRTRPLSMVATENATCSPRATPEPSSENEEQFPVSRDQVSQLLGSKDPAWFKQTADRGENSPAYRRNQVEDSDTIEVVSLSRRQLPGMEREPAPLSEKISNLEEVDRSISTSRQISSNLNTEKSSHVNISLRSTGISSPLPLTDAQRFEPPAKTYAESDSFESGRNPAMSPSQGRISPDRPASPTKGRGGFVESAKLKRSDSVSKRWSMQSPPGMIRGNSVVSNRGSVDPIANVGLGGIVNRDPRTGGHSKDNSPQPLSRPTSSHSNAIVTQFSERPDTSSSMRSSLTTSTSNDGFVKPLPPSSRALSKGEGEVDSVENIQEDITPSGSPLKPRDSRRWSPVKSSWLESALSKPDSPKPKVTPLPPQQPAWMIELNKSKQRGNTDQARNQPMHKHEVNIGGFLRSPTLGGPIKPLGSVGIPVGTPTIAVKKGVPSNTTPEPESKVDTPASLFGPSQGLIVENTKSTEPVKSTLSGSNKTTAPVSGRAKPKTPPKIDFRSNLKSRQAPSDDDTKEEPEFKNVFGQLRRTKTQNYVAPDELKDNILRGKAGLSVTGGPKKTERKDEFKEAILKKKEDFKRSQLDGTGVTRSTSGSSQKPAPLPEALAKKASLGRPSVDTPQKPSTLDGSNSGLSPATTKSSSLVDPSITGTRSDKFGSSRTQAEENRGGKLAERFNPALAAILARGPPSTSNPPSRTSSPLVAECDTSISKMSTDTETQKSGPQLTHMTKARARGPRRKAPSALVTSNPGLNPVESAIEDKSMSPSVDATVKQENTVSSFITKHAASQSSKQTGPEGHTTPPISPSKLDMKRRSRFLETANQNEKTVQQNDVTKPVQPVKKSDAIKSPIPKLDPTSSPSGQKLPPSAKPKPSSLSSPPLLGGQAFVSTITPKPSEVETKPQDMSRLNAVKNVALGIKAASYTESFVSVKNGANFFNRQGKEETRQSSPRVAAPIKLPTNKDEMAALVNAGLRLPESAEISSSKVVGLGLQRVSAPPAPDEKAAGIVTFKSSIKTNASSLSESSAEGSQISPPKSAMPLPPNTETKPATPRKITNQAVPQSSEASRLLVDFFGKKEFIQEFNIDTATVLSTTPEDPPKIKTLRSQLYQLTGDGKKQQVPSHQERMLFENDMYICLHTYGTLAGKKIVQVYFWAGDGVAQSSVQDAELFAQRDARSAGGKLIKITQGQEPPEFIEALGGIMIIRRGSSTKYDSLTPHILCGRRYAGSVVFDEVDFSPTTLCSGFPYLISTQSGKSYLWKGKGSGIDELSCARLIGMDFGVTGDVEEVEDGNEPPSFLNIFGANTNILKSADHWRLKPMYQTYGTKLFCADSETKSQITEVTPFTQSSLSPNRIYVLDAFFEIYIIVGSASQSQYSSFCTALLFAQEYGILAAGMQDRPFVPVSTVVLEGIPRDLKSVFRKWRDGVGPTIVRSSNPSAGSATGARTGLTRAKSLRVVPLSAALDATRF